MADYKNHNLLSSEARIQAPWIKVTFGDRNNVNDTSYTFGIFDRQTKNQIIDANGFYTVYGIKYPSYIQKLNIVKINGQVNQYTLTMAYPVKHTDDPNFFEKIFSSISNNRKITFSYGDSSMPSYCYKDEEAIITSIQQSFNFGSGGDLDATILYTIKATSSCALGQIGNFTFMNSGKKKPSDEIKRVLRAPEYKLSSLFPGMNIYNIDSLIASDDKAVEISSKTNISPLDYISYLVSCMVPDGATTDSVTTGIYILTIHDDTVYDKLYNDNAPSDGAYFRVEKTSYKQEHADAYTIDIGYNTQTIVSNFSIENNENYSMYFNYANKLYPEQYAKRLNNQGQWEDVFAPTFTSKNDHFKTRAEDISWYSKVTKYPISATITVQGLLRPATLMSYVRLNVIFPGGNKHISSGLYIVTKQVDDISDQGYKTTLSLTRISGDTFDTTN